VQSVLVASVANQKNTALQAHRAIAAHRRDPFLIRQIRSIRISKIVMPASCAPARKDNPLSQRTGSIRFIGLMRVRQ
jgi:hypothetical protein